MRFLNGWQLNSYADFKSTKATFVCNDETIMLAIDGKNPGEITSVLLKRAIIKGYAEKVESLINECNQSIKKYANGQTCQEVETYKKDAINDYEQAIEKMNKRFWQSLSKFLPSENQEEYQRSVEAEVKLEVYTLRLNRI